MENPKRNHGRRNRGLQIKRCICKLNPSLCALALELLKAVEFLQGEGVAIGDYNPLNFRYDLQRKQLGLLDTDAFQVRHDGSVIPCPVTSPEMILPELLNIRVRHHYRSPPTELFSAALMAFLILMPGRHPYDAVGSQEIADNLRMGRFRYGNSKDHCGHCVPWIIRRSAMSAAKMEDGPYHVDLRTKPPSHTTDTGSDYRAFQMAIGRARGMNESRAAFTALRSGPIPSNQIKDFAGVYLRGLKEVQNFINS